MEVIPPDEPVPIRLRFAHTTSYRYSGPVTFRKHRLVLRPRESHFEQLESMQIETQPPAKLQWFQDVFGNVIANARFDRPADQLVIRSEFVIAKKSAPGWSRSDSERGERFPVFYAGIEETATQVYRQSVYPPEVEKIRQWVNGMNLLPPLGQRGHIFTRLAEVIHQTIAYQRREVAGVQSPLETLRLTTGSCRDTAVLMMEAGRALGFATRFVSGYLESDNSKVGRGSTHAWTEIYFPDRGWVGYDPSIGQPVGSGHVAVAVSHHPRGVMPISGSFDTHGHTAQPMQVAIESERLGLVNQQGG
ncbi:MAG: transglutaminase family protein [Verrucomicrobiota bacterium]